MHYFSNQRLGVVILGILLTLVLPSVSVSHQVPEDLSGKVFLRSDMSISGHSVELSAVIRRMANQDAWQRFITSQNRRIAVYIDPRSASPSNIVASVPVVPGDGIGNTMSLAQLSERIGMPLTEVSADAVGASVRKFILDNLDILNINPNHLGPVRVEMVTPDHFEVSIRQRVDGIDVRTARLSATVSHGNLVLIGTTNWGNVTVSSAPEVAAASAENIAFTYAGGRQSQDVIRQDLELSFFPFAPANRISAWDPGAPLGGGYQHRLAWSFRFERPSTDGVWEAVIDASTGEVLSFQDTVVRVDRYIKGGVYPASNTGQGCGGPDPGKCGTMQQGYPMPFADTGLQGTPYATSAGLVQSDSTLTTHLNGRYVKIVDSLTECEAISSSVASGDLNLGGVSGDHACAWNGIYCDPTTHFCHGGLNSELACTATVDCTESGASSSAARTAYYEANKMFSEARGWLGLAWLSQEGTSKLTVRVNTTCSGDTEFERCQSTWNNPSIKCCMAQPVCAATGELAPVIAHEWGHGLDNNDATGSLSTPAEAYADIAAMYHEHTSCLGHGLLIQDPYPTDGCGNVSSPADGTFNNNETPQNQDPVGHPHCLTNCSGFRDADFRKHADYNSSNPDLAADTPLNHVCVRCGTEPHCAGAPVTQAAWDLAKYDLQQPPYYYDELTAFIVAERLFMQGSLNVDHWYTSDCIAQVSSGCNADSGYMKWIAADDTNGNLIDGTPHMQAIYAAYHRHGIACSASVIASSEGIGIGSIVPPSDYEDTVASDDVRETMQEGLDGNGVSRLDNVWRFDGLKEDVPRSLVLEGLRPANPDGDNFQFLWSNDGVNYTAISGALINKTFEAVGGLVYPFGGAFSPSMYVKVVDTSGTGAHLATVKVDRLMIGDTGVEPINQNCGLTGLSGPNLTVSASPGAKVLTWGSVTGATQYWVFRTEGHAGCDLGMTRIAKVSIGAVPFYDSDIVPGRAYYYSMMASTGADACFTRASTCQAAPLQ